MNGSNGGVSEMGFEALLTSEECEAGTVCIRFYPPHEVASDIDRMTMVG